MAIYSLSMSSVSRAVGSSALATLSYIASMKIRDERRGKTFYGFGRRERVEHVETLLPEGAPEAYKNPEVLFNAIETVDRAKNARPAKKIIVALPRELDKSTHVDIMRAFISENLLTRGYACTYAIHTDVEERNPHAHILVANRKISKQGMWKMKYKKAYALDAHGNKIPVIDPATGEQKVDARNRKQWKRRNVEVNELDKKETLKALREAWAKTVNDYLPEHLHIDHRSLKAQGIDRVPTVHEGYASREIEARGGISDRAEINREIRHANRAIAERNRIDARIQALKTALIRAYQRARELIISVASRYVPRAHERVKKRLEWIYETLYTNRIPENCEGELRALHALTYECEQASKDVDTARMWRKKGKLEYAQNLATLNTTLMHEIDPATAGITIPEHATPAEYAQVRKAIETVKREHFRNVTAPQDIARYEGYERAWSTYERAYEAVTDLALGEPAERLITRFELENIPSQPPFYPNAGEREIGRKHIENLLKDADEYRTQELMPTRDGYIHPAHMEKRSETPSDEPQKPNTVNDVRASLRNNLGKIQERNQTRNATRQTPRKRGRTR